ncbi:MAG TPA: GNAT family N-acetyltransferase [Thermoanaerobaculia bacterium]|nr:GNAT family N-acetyltransferase [Thermoanaerobaculia bacterium]
MYTVPTLIRKADGAADVATARALFEEYQQSLGFSLCFQNFDAELAGLPGAYAPPEGRLLLAFAGDEPAGCIALRKIGEEICEMKRLWVRPAFRGSGLGRRLAESLMAEARAAGYRAVRLDTLPSMAAAQALYLSLGFLDIPPYNDHPIEGTRFMEAILPPP